MKKDEERESSGRVSVCSLGRWLLNGVFSRQRASWGKGVSRSLNSSDQGCILICSGNSSVLGGEVAGACFSGAQGRGGSYSLFCSKIY